MVPSLARPPARAPAPPLRLALDRTRAHRRVSGLCAPVSSCHSSLSTPSSLTQDRALRFNWSSWHWIKDTPRGSELVRFWKREISLFGCVQPWIWFAHHACFFCPGWVLSRWCFCALSPGWCSGTVSPRHARTSGSSTTARASIWTESRKPKYPVGESVLLLIQI